MTVRSIALLTIRDKSIGGGGVTFAARCMPGKEVKYKTNTLVACVMWRMFLKEKKKDLDPIRPRWGVGNYEPTTTVLLQTY